MQQKRGDRSGEKVTGARMEQLGNGVMGKDVEEMKMDREKRRNGRRIKNHKGGDEG